MQHGLMLTSLTGVAILVTACVVTPEPQVITMAPITPEARAEIRKVGVAAAPTCLAPGDLPGVVEGAGEGALYGAGRGAYVGIAPAVLLCGDPFLCLVGVAWAVVVTPVGTVVGAGVGAATASATEEVEAAKSAMLGSIAELDPVGVLKQRIVESGNFLTPARFQACPTEAGGAACSAADVDSVVEIRGLAVEFPAAGVDWSTDFPAVMTAVACVARKPDGDELLAGQWRYKGPTVDFFDMAANDAARFRSELSRAVDALGDAIARDAFVGPPRRVTYPPIPVEKQTPGTVMRLPTGPPEAPGD